MAKVGGIIGGISGAGYSDSGSPAGVARDTMLGAGTSAVLAPAVGAMAKFLANDPRLAALMADEAGSVPMGKLPMDEASRMTRAKQMGFDTDKVRYHGTAADFPAFDIEKAGRSAGTPAERAVFLSSSPGEASMFADVAAAGAGQDGAPHVMPLLTAVRNPMEVAMRGYNPERVAELIAEAKAKGHDALLLRGLNELGGQGGEGAQLAVFDPNLIRSRFAAFDPAASDTAELLGVSTPGLAAALAAGGGAAGASLAPQAETRKDGVLTRSLFGQRPTVPTRSRGRGIGD